MQVKSVATDDLKNIDPVCIAIGRPRARENQQHIGFYFKDVDGDVKILHLAWHYDLRKDDPSEKYLWLDLALDPINKEHLATVLELVYETNKDGIPYGICIDGSGFAKDGSFTAAEQHAGLTCATFVIQVLHSQKYFIVDLDLWKHRQADKIWQRQIMQALESHATKEHIEYQRTKILSGAARFKPEEVAVAASLINPPHGFEKIKKPANQLLNTIVEYSNLLKRSGS